MGNHPTKHGGRDKPKKNVHWKSAEPPSPPGKPVLVPGTPNTAPDVVTIRWQRSLNDGGSPIIGYLVEHRRTGSPHWVRATPQLVQTIELSLSGLEPGWRYQFRVIAENVVGKSDSSELSDPLTVTLQRNAITAPRFMSELQDTIAVENEKVEFKVAVVGTPPPQVSWFKDGFEIFSSRRTKIVAENEMSILVIHQCALTDDGEIKCAATNRAGHAVTRARLNIEAYPKIRLPRQYEEGLIIEAEEVIRLKVGLAGRPSPSVIWSHNGETLNDGGRYEIQTNDKNSSLKIINSQREDRGEYNLRAVNKLGEDNASFLVTITARPQEPGKVVMSMSLGKTVTLAWAPPDDDGGCKIGNYIVEYYRIGWDVWLKAATCRQLTTTLNDLIEGSEYKFRVKAENPYGLSDPGEESDILFVPDAKRGINNPENIKEMPIIETDLSPAVAPRKRRDESRSPPKEDTDDHQTKKIKGLTPEFYDQDELQRDMSYGAPEDFYKHKEMAKSNQNVNPSVEEQARMLKPFKNVVTLDDPVSDRELSIPRVVVTPEPPQKEETAPIAKPELKVEKIPSLNNLNEANDKNNAIHNSSEFMLVLYNDQESKNNKRNTKFDFELDELVAPPPPLSLSAPELNVEMPPAPFMRAAVSSTELLYERAMARFYQAVAFEESENARKESISVDREALRRPSFNTDQPIQPRLRINSLTDGDRRSSLKRRMSGDRDFSALLPRQSSLTENTETDLKHSEIKEENIESLAPPEPEKEDYTDEYASSVDSAMDDYQGFFNKVRNSKLTEDDEMETYHPRVMTHRLTSPYSSPDPSQACEVLTKPLPLPDPNFVPKPILKRPSVEVLAKEEKDKSKKKAPDKPERKSLKPSSDVSSSNSNLDLENFDSEYKHPEVPREKYITKVTESVPEIKISDPEISKEEEEAIAAAKAAAELIKQKKLQIRQNSEEEYRAVADFYGDIVKEVGSRIKQAPKIPLYMNPEGIRNAERLEKEESNQNLAKYGNDNLNEVRRSRSPSLPVETRTIRKSRSPSLTVDLQKSKSPSLLLEHKNPPKSPVANNISQNNVNSSAFINDENTERSRSRGRLNDRDTKKETGTVPKKRVVSKTRSRSGSAVRKTAQAPTKEEAAVEVAPPRRFTSKTRLRSESKSPSALKRKVYPVEPPVVVRKEVEPIRRPKSPEPKKIEIEIVEVEVQDSVKSFMSYVTDLALFSLACWLYIFKDPKLAIPILALMVYRHIHDIIKDKIPSWVKRKLS